MRRLLVVFTLLALFAVPSAQANLLINGDFQTGDETGWTRWRAPWGSGENWAVDDCECGGCCVPPSGHLSFAGGGQGSFGWFQRIPVVESEIYTICGSWCGDVGGAGWAEVMFFSCTAGQSDDDIIARIDTGNASDIAVKKDSWGMNPPTAWACEGIELSPHPDGPGMSIHATCAEIVVALKLGNVAGDNPWVCYDMLQVVPEPATVALLGLGGLGLLRRRR
jgi:hypothetical protein